MFSFFALDVGFALLLLSLVFLFFLCGGAGHMAVILLHRQITLQGSQGERQVLAEMTPQEFGFRSVLVSRGALVTNHHK